MKETSLVHLISIFAERINNSKFSIKEYYGILRYTFSDCLFKDTVFKMFSKCLSKTLPYFKWWFKIAKRPKYDLTLKIQKYGHQINKKRKITVANKKTWVMDCISSWPFFVKFLLWVHLIKHQLKSVSCPEWFKLEWCKEDLYSHTEWNLIGRIDFCLSKQNLRLVCREWLPNNFSDFCFNCQQRDIRTLANT